MHYTGTIWRPPYEAASLLLEVTAGCTHHKCKFFCTSYNVCRSNSECPPLEDIESDLREVERATKGWNSGRIDRIFLTGANPSFLPCCPVQPFYCWIYWQLFKKSVSKAVSSSS